MVFISLLYAYKLEFPKNRACWRSLPEAPNFKAPGSGFFWHFLRIFLCNSIKKFNLSSMSFVWFFFEKNEETNCQKAKCIVGNCKSKLSIVDGHGHSTTGGMIKHLATIHSITRENYKEHGTFYIFIISKILVPTPTNSIVKYATKKVEAHQLICELVVK